MSTSAITQTTISDNFYDLFDECLLCRLSNYSSGINENIGRTEITPGIIPESMLNQIVADLDICAARKKAVVVDFSGIDDAKFAGDMYKAFVSEDVALIDVGNKFIKFFEEKCRLDGKKLTKIGDTSNFVYFCDSSETSPIHRLLNKIRQDHKADDSSIAKIIRAEIVASYLRETRDIYDERLEYVESSNVYVNQYINIKHLFSNPKMLCFVVSQMQQTVLEQFRYNRTLDEITFLGVSNNGALLARILGYATKRPCLWIDHLGPNYCMNNEEKWVNHLRNKNFVLIIDVVLMGNEYKMAKVLAHAFNSQIIGCIAIAKVNDVYREGPKRDKFYYIIDDVNKYGFDYKVYINIPNEEVGEGE